MCKWSFHRSLETGKFVQLVRLQVCDIIQRPFFVFSLFCSSSSCQTTTLDYYHSCGVHYVIGDDTKDLFDLTLRPCTISLGKFRFTLEEHCINHSGVLTYDTARQLLHQSTLHNFLANYFEHLLA